MIITFRIDDKEKSEFEQFCNSVGITPSAALSLFIRKTITTKRIPFDISNDERSLAEKEEIKTAVASKKAIEEAVMKFANLMSELNKFSEMLKIKAK
ncbi:MAG: type II toxin-antitoxin system RelB/DinJ family antitoxin [Mycoplasmataceae bacterium]|jgi:DNA-damage-inducible protein J|nr:type II toxin-antitoxin system RelB/DinJ family antitoxin [Mycoplasmataceae bacterium]